MYESAASRVLRYWIPVALLSVFLLFPFYWMAVISVKPNSELFNLKLNPYLVVHPTLEHFQYLLADTSFLRWTLNTTIVAFASTSLSLFASIPAGYALARLRFPGAGIVGTSIFLTYLVPPTLLFIPLAVIVNRFGLANSYWALILTYPTFLIPFATWLLTAYFRTIPRELEECAVIDGSSRLGAMCRIALPLAAPGIVSAGIFSFTLSWNEFLYALIFMSSSVMKTVPVGTVNELIKGDVTFWGSLMSAGLLGSVPVAVIIFFFADYYVQGLTAGAVKG